MSLSRWWAHGMRGSMLEDAEEYGSGKDQYQSLHRRVSRLFRFRKRKPASAQEKSNLFTILPLDIRILIYEQVFDKLGFCDDLHIVRSCVVLHGLRCFKCEARTNVNDPDSWPAHRLHGTGERHYKNPERYMDGILSFLKTCQRMYVCSSLPPVCFSHSTISTGTQKPLRFFTDASLSTSSMSPQHAAS